MNRIVRSRRLIVYDMEIKLIGAINRRLEDQKVTGIGVVDLFYNHSSRTYHRELYGYIVVRYIQQVDAPFF